MKKHLLLVLLFIIGCSKEIIGEKTIDGAGDPNDDDQCSLSFNFNQSSSQAFYYFRSVDIEGEPVDTLDWVGAFNGDICVGSKQWNTGLCGGGVCDLPVMGYDVFDQEGTAGYMQPGDLPTFKIYDVSEGVIYEATTTDNVPIWQNNMTSSVLDTLRATISSVADCQ